MFINFASFSKIGLSSTADVADFFALMVAKIERLHGVIIHEFGPNGVYIIILFALFLFTIILIYIKSVIDTFRPEADENSDAGLMFLQNDRNETEDEDIDDEYINDDGFSEEELKDMLLINREKELSRKLVEYSETTDDIFNLKASLKQQSANKDNLDWHKDLAAENIPAKNLSKDNLFYQQAKESLSSLICLIINMLSRNVSPEKIAQAVYTRNQAENSKEDILQIIQAIRDFIGICISGQFDKLPNRENLPTNQEAIFMWANGNNSACLALLESLIQKQIALAETLHGSSQEIAYAQASSFACIFGTIASLDNIDLAINSFELALDLTPKSVNAWSRCADMYWRKHDYENAVFAYKTVLDMGDEFMYDEQKANANDKLASYYAEIGKTEKALKMQEAGKQFYLKSGIATELSEAEGLILDIITLKQTENLTPAITTLLNQNYTASL